MSQFNTLQLKNSAAAEQDFTVGTINTQTGVATWFGPYGMDSSQEGRPQATFSLQLPSAKSNKARCKLKISVPVLDSMTNKKLDEDIFTCEFALSKLSSLTNRQNLLAYAQDYLLDSVVEKAVEGFEGVY